MTKKTAKNVVKTIFQSPSPFIKIEFQGGDPSTDFEMVKYFQQDGYTEIDMTLTTMGCPLADLLTDQIYDAMKEVPEVTKTEVKLVWTPAWTVEKMSRYARIALGIR